MPHSDSLTWLDAPALRALAETARTDTPCATCAPITHRGWESFPGGFDRDALQPVGTLRRADIEDPTVEEFHPHGTHAWSPDAPIAPDWFPTNRCDVWRCTACARAFLRYTEYGGYYQEERVRLLDPALIVDPA